MQPEIKDTACCSLVQIRARNSTTKQALNRTLGNLKRRKKHAAFVITTPDELTLVETLRSLDFVPVTEFKRCNEGGFLTMWIKRW